MMARQKSLQPLAVYLRERGRTKGADLVAGFEAMRGKGVAIEIRRIEPKGSAPAVVEQ